MNQTIKLDTRKREGKYGEARIAPLRRGERNNVLLTVKVCANGQPYDLAGKTASLVATTAAGKLVGPYPMECAEAGIARIMLPAALYSAVGTFSGYVEIREGETLVDTTDSFGGKVIECADLDSEQAAEFTPLLGELQNAVAEEAKRAEAEKARAQAETERVAEFAEAKQAAQTATHKANTAATEAKKAAGSASAAAESANTAATKADSAAKKAETAAETADAANTAANKAVGDAQAAIAEVKATEAKLYPAAENILVGGESGTVAHVDDAFNGASLRKIVVKGAAKQDGTPSPEAPVPIEVVEHPVVRVAGRNLWLFASSYTSIEGHQNEFVKEGTPFTLLPGTYTFSATGSLGNTDAPLFGYTPTGKRIQLFRILRNVANPKYGFTVTEPITSVYFIANAADSKTGTISNIQIERNSEATEYKPHTSQSLTFALPEEHPYLAKLPDGTADTIEADREGNVELVARVHRQLLTDWRDTSIGYFICGFERMRAGSSGLSTIGEILNKESAGSIWTGTAMGFVAYTPKGSETLDDMKAMNILAYLSCAEKRYPLGKIEIPKARDTILNAWTDAEVTPNTSIEYVRDVNIVVSRLESAIASITEG